MNNHYIKVNKRHALAIILLIVLIILAVLAFIFIEKLEFKLSDTGEEDVFVLGSRNPELEYNGKLYRYNEDVQSLLVMGIDSYEKDVTHNSYNNTDQADFLMVLAVNSKEGTCKALQIDRDTITNNRILGVTGDVIDYKNEQVALSHTYGSGGHDSARNTLDAISNMMYGMEIEHYMAFAMDAVAEYNDLVGGVTINKGEVGPDGKTLSSDITLKGDDALSYVRARRGLDDPTNVARMDRQRNYLKHLREATKAKSESDDAFVLDAIMTVNDYMTSDLNVNELSSISESVMKYADGTILVPKGESVDGELYKEFYIDSDDLLRLIIEMFYEEA